MLLELVELAAVDQPGDDLVHVIGRADIVWHQRIEVLGIEIRRARILCRDGPCGGVIVAQMADDIAHDGQRMLVVLGQMIDHARLARMQIAAAKVLGADLLARRGLHQRRTGKEDRALFAHDHRFVGHGRDVGPARGAAAHHAGDLRNAQCRHVRLVEEDAPEMVAIGEDLRLVRQVRPAAVDEVDARQTVLLRDLLSAQVLLDRHRVIGAALHGGIVADDHYLAARHAPDPGDQPRAVDFVFAVHAVRGQLPDFEKGAARIEQPLHPLARQ